MTQTCIRCGAPKESDEKQCEKCGSSNFTASTDTPEIAPIEIKTEDKVHPIPESEEEPTLSAEMVKEESPIKPIPREIIEESTLTITDEDLEKFEQLKEQQPIIIEDEIPKSLDDPQVKPEYLEKLNEIMKEKGIIFETEEDFVKFFAESPEKVQKIEEPHITIMKKEEETSDKYPKFVTDAMNTCNRLLKPAKKEQPSQETPAKPESVEVEDITLPHGDALREIKEEVKLNQLIGVINLVLVVILIFVIAFTF